MNLATLSDARLILLIAMACGVVFFAGMGVMWSENRLQRVIASVLAVSGGMFAILLLFELANRKL